MSRVAVLPPVRRGSQGETRTEPEIRPEFLDPGGHRLQLAGAGAAEGLHAEAPQDIAGVLGVGFGERRVFGLRGEGAGQGLDQEGIEGVVEGGGPGHRRLQVGLAGQGSQVAEVNAAGSNTSRRRAA